MVTLTMGEESIVIIGCSALQPRKSFLESVFREGGAVLHIVILGGGNAKSGG